MLAFLDPFLPIVNEFAPLVGAFLLIFARVSIFTFLLPGLSDTMIPVQVRLLASMAIALLLLTFMAAPEISPLATPTLYASVLFIEALKGFILGLSLRMMIFVLQFAGSFISQLLSLSQAFGISTNTDNDALISSLFVISATTLAVTLNLHTEAVLVLHKTYTTMPIGETVDLGKMTYWLTIKAVGVFDFALSLSLPFVALGFVYNLVLGAANRAMPQLMVAFVGMPAITLLGIIILALLSGGILILWARELSAILLEMAI